MKHFTINELTASATAAERGYDNTPPAAAVEALERLVDNVLDPLREAYGRAIYVTSGYRCAELNRAVGGVKNSQHIVGEAADVTTGTAAGNRRLIALIKRLRLPVDQVIDERDGSWVHISHGPRQRGEFIKL